MNQYFYESRGNEKIKELLREGQTNQALRRSGAPKLQLQRRVPKLALVLLSILGMLTLLH